MKHIYYSEAIRDGIRNEMLKDPHMFVIGESVGLTGGCFGATVGLYDEFGPERVRDTPISEQAIVGIAAGAASTGVVPIAELMYNDFIGCAGDQIINQAAKLRYMYGGKMKVPMVLRLPCGGGIQGGAQHSQSLEAILTHIPGLKVVYPSTPADAQGLIIAAIRDENPVMVFEHQVLYAEKGDVPEDMEPIPIGKADIKREGSDVTVVATGLCVKKSLEAAEILEKEGINIEVVDPRSLYPLDKDLIYNSIKKTGKVVIVTEENKRGAWSGELAACIAEDIFPALAKPVVRVGALDVPIPFTANLEEYVLPQVKDIVAAVKKIAD